MINEGITMVIDTSGNIYHGNLGNLGKIVEEIVS